MASDRAVEAGLRAALEEHAQHDPGDGADATASDDPVDDIRALVTRLGAADRMYGGALVVLLEPSPMADELAATSIIGRTRVLRPLHLSGGRKLPSRAGASLASAWRGPAAWLQLRALGVRSERWIATGLVDALGYSELGSA